MIMIIIITIMTIYIAPFPYIYIYAQMCIAFHCQWIDVGIHIVLR